MLAPLNPDDDYQVIEATPRSQLINIFELWEYRELLVFLSLRDIQVRYKQTVLGISWAIIQPFMQMVVFSVFFGTLAQLPSDGRPYPIFNYAGLLPWTFFAASISKSTNSLVGNSNLIKKVYFPRTMIPLSAVLSNIPDFLLAFLVMIGLMLYYNVGINLFLILATIPFLMIAFVAALGIGFWLSALNALYRDVGHTVPFFIQLMFFITPILYSASLVNSNFLIFYSINPMVVVVQGFRWLLIGTNAPDPLMIISACAISLLLLITGLIFFKRTERIFADLV